MIDLGSHHFIDGVFGIALSFRINCGESELQTRQLEISFESLSFSGLRTKTDRINRPCRFGQCDADWKTDNEDDGRSDELVYVEFHLVLCNGMIMDVMRKGKLRLAKCGQPCSPGTDVQKNPELPTGLLLGLERSLGDLAC